MVFLLSMFSLSIAQGQTAGMLLERADSLYHLQQYEMAKTAARQALPLAVKEGNVEAQGDLLNLMAVIHIRLGDFRTAARFARQCNELDMKSGNADNISSSFNTLAGIYMSMRQPKEAEKYILKAIGYARQVDNPQRMAVLHGMASEVYHHLKQEERSLDYATKAYEMERRLGRRDKMAVRQAERAAALIALKRSSEAMDALGEAIPGLRESGNRHSLGIACNQMGLLMHEQQDDSAAVVYFTEALGIFLSQKDIYNESHTRRGLYKALRKTNPVLAMEHNDRYNELRDSLYDSETGRLLTKYAAELGYDELQAENADMRLSRRVYLIIGVAVVMLLLLLLVFSIWYVRRQNQRHIQRLIREISELKASDVSGNATADLGEPASESEDDGTEKAAEVNELFKLRVIEAVNVCLSTGHYGVEDIAGQLNMGVQTFRRRLQSVTGESPKAFISAIQMELAAKLLTNHADMPISRIASSCGYGEITSFGRAFRKTYGVSPSQYRSKAL